MSMNHDAIHYNGTMSQKNMREISVAIDLSYIKFLQISLELQ